MLMLRQLKTEVQKLKSGSRNQVGPTPSKKLTSKEPRPSSKTVRDMLSEIELLLLDAEDAVGSLNARLDFAERQVVTKLHYLYITL